jgi:hypothetical protein
MIDRFRRSSLPSLQRIGICYFERSFAIKRKPRAISLANKSLKQVTFTADKFVP